MSLSTTATSAADPAAWQIGSKRRITLDRPLLIGILNVTPDSFSDGGRWTNPCSALRHAEAMIRDGADIIDIGGESTRPGADRIKSPAQIERVVPVIRAMREAGIECPITIDTTRSDVARAALDAGADAINDVSGGLDDPAILTLAAQRRAGLILMHRLRPPDADTYSDRYETPPDYGDQPGAVVDAVERFLLDRARAAIDAGALRESIVIDPGLGFGKSVAQNFELAAAAPRLLKHEFPLLCAVSRKSFIGHAMGIAQPERRDEGSIALAVQQFAMGVRLFRVHNVAAHRAALRVACALRTHARP